MLEKFGMTGINSHQPVSLAVTCDHLPFPGLASSLTQCRSFTHGFYPCLFSRHCPLSHLSWPPPCLFIFPKGACIIIVRGDSLASRMPSGTFDRIQLGAFCCLHASCVHPINFSAKALSPLMAVFGGNRQDIHNILLFASPRKPL